jgi:hypothetical protein
MLRTMPDRTLAAFVAARRRPSANAEARGPNEPQQGVRMKRRLPGGRDGPTRNGSSGCNAEMPKTAGKRALADRIWRLAAPKGGIAPGFVGAMDRKDRDKAEPPG